MEVLSLLGILLVLLLVLGGCYLFTRWAGVGLGGRLGLTPSGGRLPVGRDQALLVVEAANRHFLLGSSPSGLSLLAELTEEEAALWTSPPPPGGGQQGPDFRQWLGKLREKK